MIDILKEKQSFYHASNSDDLDKLGAQGSIEIVGPLNKWVFGGSALETKKIWSICTYLRV